MCLLVWVTLLSAVRSSSADTVSRGENPKLTPEAGLCVEMRCFFSPGTVEFAVGHKCEHNVCDSDIILRLNNTDPHAQSGFGGPVSLLEPDLSPTNCSIIISDLTGSDSGSYQLTVLNATTQGNASHGAFIAVKDLIQKPTVMIPPLTEGQQTTLTCTALGLCFGSDPEITWTWRGAGGNDSDITGNITAFKTENLTAVIQTHSSTLTFNPSVIHNGTEVICKVSFPGGMTAEETVTLNVNYVKKSEITGTRTVKEGDTLNLTCYVDGFPPYLVMWTKVPSNKNLQNRTETELQNNTGAATLVITHVTADHAGQYICTAKHLNTTVTLCANVTVTSHPRILNSSGCITQSELLMCVCMSQSQWFPLPTIRWPLLENHTEYSVTTTVSNHTVNSTMMLSVKDQSITVVECVSSSENGEVKENLIINKAEQEEQEEDQYMKLLRMVTQLEVIIAFLIGALLSAIICCLVRKCHRKKRTTSNNLAETLEMVTSHKDLLIDAGQAVEDDQAFVQETPEAGGDAAAVGKSDVEYSDLDFSLIKAPSPAEAGTTETEYAEIKKEKAGERQDGEGSGEEEVVMGVHGETKENGPEEEVALYSTVEDIMDQI
ncbi:uncharacterized protein LOC143324917 [Chaetodon auriga]|uniref:uncharacterized protein LOC143324917 n=1 Tax=Chaetodon auriga TaxID=39042 RepID=UPI004032ED83